MVNLRLFTIIFIFYFGIIAHSQIIANNSDSIGEDKNQIILFGENVLDYFTYQTSSGIWSLYPAGGYSSRTGLEFGIMPVYSWYGKKPQQGIVNTFTSSLQFSTKGMVEVSSQLEWFISPRWRLQNRVDLLNLYDRYWGSWSENFNEGLRYKSNSFGGRIGFSGRISSTFYFGIASDIRHFGLNLSDDQIQELNAQKRGLLSGIGPSFLFDNRDHVLYPQKGSYLNSSWILYQNKLIGDYEFNNFLLDLRHYLTVGRPVLAFQFLWEYSKGDVPFFVIPQLGGKDRLRGIGHSNRVVDNSVCILKSEMRSHLFWRIGAVLFLEAGKASEIPDFKPADLIYSYGGGLRFRIHPNEPLNIRIDAALSSINTYGLFISLKETF